MARDGNGIGAETPGPKRRDQNVVYPIYKEVRINLNINVSFNFEYFNP